MRFLGSGKVKDIYELDGGALLFRFSDRVSAYDVRFQESIPRKGEVLCKFAKFWFEQLQVPNHFVRLQSNTEIVVKRMAMLPIECIVRGYFYGSLVSRAEKGQASLLGDIVPELAAKLPEPIFDPTTKAHHDVPVTRDEAMRMGLVIDREYDRLEKESIRIYEQMAEIARAAGFILADLKLEFGKVDGEIVLGDSIGPDECRLWLERDYEVGRVQEAYDKQILRDWISAMGYKSEFDAARDAGQEPRPPAIPPEIIQKMTERYVEAYEKITGRTL